MSANHQFQGWLEQIRGIGGPNPLTNLDTEVSGLVNLERAHPVGMSLFTRSHRGLLANLIRDPISYSKALTEAKRAKIKSDRNRSELCSPKRQSGPGKVRITRRVVLGQVC